MAIALAALVGCSACGEGRGQRGEADRTDAASSDTASSSRRGAATQVPSLDVPHLLEGASIAIDGELGEAAWGSAAATGDFVDAGSGRSAVGLAVGGRARLLWDAQFLYLGFEVRDRAIRGGFPAGSVDPHLWERDTIEVMLDPGGDNRNYVEIQVSPQNLVFDSRFDDYNLPRGGPQGPFGHQAWSSSVESAVRLGGSIDDEGDEDEGYVVELRIPFSALPFPAPKAGDTWRANLYAMQDNGGVAWSPILGQGNFHRASRFGHLRFTQAN